MRAVRLFCLGIALLMVASCAFEDEEAILLDNAANKQVIDGITPEMRETAAHEVAMQAKAGRAPLLPLLYWSRFTYTPVMDGSCMLIVTEKNMSLEITQTFRFNLCD